MNRRSFMAGTVGAVSASALVGATQAPPKPKTPPEETWRIPPHARLSFSQQGEDIVLFHLLRDAMKIDGPTYLDIGAADPIEANNTYLLHWTGGHGVLVEPNPMYQQRLHMHRPNDVIVQAGVGVRETTQADYYVIRGNPALNTFSADDVAVRRKEAGGQDVVEQVIKMPLVTVNDLIARHLGKAPSLLSIDVEGWDLAIFRSLDFRKYRPAVVIAESQPTGPIPSFLRSKGYVLRGASMYNVIFADPKQYR